MKKLSGITLAGLLAGAVNGLFGAGGGMVLVPLLTKVSAVEEQEVFPASVCMILPMCLVSLFMSINTTGITWSLLISYLIGSAAGGIIAGLTARKIPTLWLHRILGVMIIWGGIRYIW